MNRTHFSVKSKETDSKQWRGRRRKRKIQKKQWISANRIFCCCCEQGKKWTKTKGNSKQKKKILFVSAKRNQRTVFSVSENRYLYCGYRINWSDERAFLIFYGENIYRLLKWKSNFDFRAYANSWNFHSFFSFTSINPFWLRNFSIRLFEFWVVFVNEVDALKTYIKRHTSEHKKNWFWFVASSFFSISFKSIKGKSCWFLLLFQIDRKIWLRCQWFIDWVLV